MPTLVSTWYGTFRLDGSDIADKRLVTQDPHAIAERLATMRAGTVLDDERALAEGIDAITVHERRLLEVGHRLADGPVPAPPFDPRASGYPARLLHDALLLLAVRETHMEFAQRDRLIVHQVKALDEIVKSANTLAERLREWYAVHAPEVVARVEEHADLARLVATKADRQAVAAALDGLHLSEMGVAAPPADEAIVRTFSNGLATLYDTWDEIEGRLTTTMEEVAPNLSAVAGPMLGARLIAAAGGLEDLALCPSGTVQTLGAETALFRHLKDGSPPPKHGLLIQYEAVNRAPWWQRGKIARALSGKIAIAAKADAFGDDTTRGVALAKEVAARIEEIQAKYPKPPQRGPRPGGHGRGPDRARGRPRRARA